MSLHFIFDKFSECPFKTKIFKLQFLLDKSSKSYTDNYTFRLLFELKCLPEPRLPLVLRLRGFESSVSDEVDDSVDFLLSLLTRMLDRCLPWPLCLKVALMSSAEKPWFLIMWVFSLSLRPNLALHLRHS